MLRSKKVFKLAFRRMYFISLSSSHFSFLNKIAIIIIVTISIAEILIPQRQDSYIMKTVFLYNFGTILISSLLCWWLTFQHFLLFFSKLNLYDIRQSCIHWLYVLLYLLLGFVWCFFQLFRLRLFFTLLDGLYRLVWLMYCLLLFLFLGRANLRLIALDLWVVLDFGIRLFFVLLRWLIYFMRLLLFLILGLNNLRLNSLHLWVILDFCWNIIGLLVLRGSTTHKFQYINKLCCILSDISYQIF